MAETARLQKHYREVVRPKLRSELGLGSDMQVPRLQKITLNMGVSEAVADKKVMDHAVADLTKITINMGVGEAVTDKKVIENAVADLTKIAGQKPIVTKAKKAISNFKVREGWPVGCKVTLRRDRMWEFLDRLVSISLPRVRDFRGVSARAFDGRGNYTLGVKEQIIFPEIDFDKIDVLRGMDITFTTTAKTDDEAKALLKAFSFPFRN